MNINIKFVPHDTNNWEVTRAIAQVIHSEDFAPIVAGRRINFSVKLNPNKAGGVGNDGNGVLTVPTEQIGHKFLTYVFDTPIRLNSEKVKGQKLKFWKAPKPPPPGFALTLGKTPYVEPDIEEERQEKICALQEKLRVDAVQFGIYYRDKYPEDGSKKIYPRCFSIEWEEDTTRGYADLSFEYDHKLIRINVGSELQDSEGSSIAISFASIQKLGVGYDGKPYVCFDTLTPPVLERIEFHRTMTGDRERDNRKYKQRIDAINEGHRLVAPYAPHIRLTFYNDHRKDVVLNFIEMCKVAGIADSRILHFRNPNAPLDAGKKLFFASKRLHILHKDFAKFDFPIAFQLESLLHNGLLHTGDLDQLVEQDVRPLTKQHAKRGSGYVGDLLRRYNEALQLRFPYESPRSCFQRVIKDFEYGEPKAGTFRCCHVTFTPTRLILEGPYATQSNRIIRQYPGFEDHFIRVDFRDEDRLQYRWDREVDGASFLRDRVGHHLKNGFNLAGRQFEFLAYSSSALREHAVWFMNPFRHQHPEKGWVNVNAQFIRDEIGKFKGTPLLKCPSKYAARIAQAFTATEGSVDIKKEEWEEIDDLICKDSAYMFTDGVGTISRSLADRIWKKLTEHRRDAEKLIPPSAYQIRFLGYKGVVAVDEELGKLDNGIHMRLRPSMRKFEVTHDGLKPIEIAQAFEQPNTAYLNRPLIMVLEDVGVRKEAFIDLQNLAVAEARTIDDSIDKFQSVVSAHNLGSAYRLRDILGRLKKECNMDLRSDGKTVAVDDPFLRKLRRVAMNDILRDIKHSARIPIKDNYLLVGVADEGPAYEKMGYKNVYCLQESQIYVCIQKPGDEEPTWLEGTASISRSPVAHPGDVQRVRAIGKPPEGMLCLFRNLKNVVVMPSKGTRSLASCLGGGDVDGDLFSVISHESLLPTALETAANYESAGTLTLDRDSEVDDICDFIVEYIKSDVLGLLSDRLITIADQSSEGIHDPDCLRLAALCSQAVDYPKQGIPVDLDDEKLPRPLIRCKPDWHAAEVVSPRKTDYYESSRALGFLFRSITLDDPAEIADEEPKTHPMSDPITLALWDKVQDHLGDVAHVQDTPREIKSIFKRYHDELRYICTTHTLSNSPGTSLLEAEVVIGTILAKCSQKRWRKDRIYRMRLHASTLVKDVQSVLMENAEDKSYSELLRGLELAWKAWHFSVKNRKEFGANSFGLIALGTIFECLDKLSQV